MYSLSPQFKELVASRIRETLPEQKKVYQHIKTGRPLDAEDDDNRKLSYIKRKVGVSTPVAKEIAAYKDVTTLNLPQNKISKAESLQGPTVDFMSICFVDLAKAASHAVARVVFLDGRPQGTGFMISPSLFLTNQHVIRDAADANRFELEFNYEQDFKQNALTKTRYRLNPDAFFLSSPETDLDFSLIAIGQKIEGPIVQEDLGFLPLFDADDKHIISQFVNCIEHPNGNYKQLVVRENRLAARTTNTLIYSSDTLPGASGSPVFNDDWEVIALHHYGEPYRAVLDAPDKDGLPANGNEGIRISSIVKHLAGLKNLPSHQQALLTEALSYNFRQPSLLLTKTEKANKEHEPDPATEKTNLVINDIHNKTISTMATSDQKTISFTIPLTISVQLGNSLAINELSGKGSKSSTETDVQGESLSPDPDYKNRKGYDKHFLGVVIKMPRLSLQQLEKAAKNKKDGSTEFKYEHFSIVMNGERRLAYFTAVNIDGASVVKINRKTGTVTSGPEAAEGREKWFDDERIDPAEVCQDALYRKPDMSIFQRGHLVKRTDPSWGTEEKAIKGQADTFHFTNCSPQHFQFNPNKTRWAGVEDWITNTSDDDNIRVTVFSGPVFEDNDPVMGGLLIPKSFWKVVAWMEEGELKATGILATQAMLLGVMPEAIGKENLNDIPDKLPVDYHVSISHLQDITGLDFGKLAEADTFPKNESINDSSIRQLPLFKGDNWEI